MIRRRSKKFEPERSFFRRKKKARAIVSQNHFINHTGNSGLQKSGDDVNDLNKSIIEEFSLITASDGLITGTNKVLRLLEKERLAAVFIYKDKASYHIKNSLHMICRQAGVPLIFLEDKDKHVLNRKFTFPKSITYGVKKEPVGKSEHLRDLLLEFFTKINKKFNVGNKVSSTNISSIEMKFPPTEERKDQEILSTSVCYHIHKDISKKSISKETGFLSLNKFSTDERETDFLDYDSVACSGVLSIK